MNDPSYNEEISPPGDSDLANPVRTYYQNLAEQYAAKNQTQGPGEVKTPDVKDACAALAITIIVAATMVTAAIFTLVFKLSG